MRLLRVMNLIASEILKIEILFEKVTCLNPQGSNSFLCGNFLLAVPGHKKGRKELYLTLHVNVSFIKSLLSFVSP